MKWEKVEIKDICTGIYDGPHATPPLSDTGAIFKMILFSRMKRH